MSNRAIAGRGKRHQQPLERQRIAVAEIEPQKFMGRFAIAGAATIDFHKTRFFVFCQIAGFQRTPQTFNQRSANLDKPDRFWLFNGFGWWTALLPPVKQKAWFARRTADFPTQEELAIRNGQCPVLRGIRRQFMDNERKGLRRFDGQHDTRTVQMDPTAESRQLGLNNRFQHGPVERLVGQGAVGVGEGVQAPVEGLPSLF